MAIPLLWHQVQRQTGFGRTGTVDWDTTAKTATFTAVSVAKDIFVIQQQVELFTCNTS